VNSVPEFLDHPVLAERDRWREVAIPGAHMRALVPPAGLAGVPPRMDPVPAPGEHTARILAELGYA
jgi:formyl-CoA transferase